jgi:ABC-2 type transport system ATP-binding protein
MMPHAIRIRNVTKTFGSTRAVSDLSLDVPAGSLCGFLGPNGAGKSTTLRMVMSIIYPDGGSIEVLGGSALDRKDQIGYLPEERGIYRKMRVGEFLEYMARLKGVPGHGLGQRIRDRLDRVELGHVLTRRCQELSKGMQQKVQVLAAIIHEPELIILDEPFSGLDPVNATLLNGLIRELHDEGRTIIFSTHILHQAEQVCDRIFLIHRGVKLLDGTMEEIRARFDPRTILAVPADGALRLDGIGEVASARPVNGGAAMELFLTEGADPHEVMRRIVLANDVRSIELRRVSLEEMFVRLVLRESGEAAAEQARLDLEGGEPETAGGPTAAGRSAHAAEEALRHG